MATKKDIKELIGSLTKNNFHASCPHCYNDFKLKGAGLFHLDDFTPEAQEMYNEMQEGLKERRALFW